MVLWDVYTVLALVCIVLYCIYHTVTYTFLVLRSKLDTAVHWFLCNLCISEVVHYLLFGVSVYLARTYQTKYQNYVKIRDQIDVQERSGVEPDLYGLSLANGGLDSSREILDQTLMCMCLSWLSTLCFACAAIYQFVTDKDNSRGFIKQTVFSKRHGISVTLLWISVFVVGVIFTNVSRVNTKLVGQVFYSLLCFTSFCGLVFTSVSVWWLCRQNRNRCLPSHSPAAVQILRSSLRSSSGFRSSLRSSQNDTEDTERIEAVEWTAKLRLFGLVSVALLAFLICSVLCLVVVPHEPALIVTNISRPNQFYPAVAMFLYVIHLPVNIFLTVCFLETMQYHDSLCTRERKRLVAKLRGM